MQRANQRQITLRIPPRSFAKLCQLQQLMGRASWNALVAVAMERVTREVLTNPTSLSEIRAEVLKASARVTNRWTAA